MRYRFSLAKNKQTNKQKFRALRHLNKCVYHLYLMLMLIYHIQCYLIEAKLFYLYASIYISLNFEMSLAVKVNGLFNLLLLRGCWMLYVINATIFTCHLQSQFPWYLGFVKTKKKKKMNFQLNCLLYDKATLKSFALAHTHKQTPNQNHISHCTVVVVVPNSNIWFVICWTVPINCAW